MRIGIYGGTFNPIHRGHLTAAAAAAKQLCLDKLLLVPDAIPPHKPLPAGSADAADLPVPAEVTDLELRRQGASYSCDTLAALREQYPADELFFLMGSDMFLSFETWRRPEGICRLATLAVFSRRTADEAAAFARQKEKLEKAFSARVTVVMNPEVIEVSSTQLREELARGRGRASRYTGIFCARGCMARRRI